MPDNEAEILNLFNMSEFIAAAWNFFCLMAPYLLIGFLVAGLLKVFVPAESIHTHLGGKGLFPIIKASLFGVPLPLCSCSVLPVCASLRKRGASRGAATAFIISTPQTGVDSIFVTYSLLGGVFAVLRPLAAFLSGLTGGILVDLASRKDNTSQVTHLERKECGHAIQAHPSSAPHKHWWITLIQHSLVELPRDMARPLITGTVVAGLISVLLPKGIFENFLGTGISSLFLMGLMGIPVYVCAMASVPVAAALMIKGVSPGAALVFLMTGPATNIASIVTLNKIIGAKATVIYMVTVGITAIVAGFAVNAFLRGLIKIKNPEMAVSHPNPVFTGLGVLLSVIFLAAWLTGRKKTSKCGME